jgi:plasmid stabilization system protein ParE
VKLPIVTRPRAAREFETAHRWYESQRQGLGDEFLDAAHELVSVIAEHSERFPIVHRDVRRAVLRRFPYSIFYRIKKGHLIVVACFHSKRNPAAWINRR